MYTSASLSPMQPRLREGGTGTNRHKDRLMENGSPDTEWVFRLSLKPEMVLQKVASIRSKSRDAVVTSTN